MTFGWTTDCDFLSVGLALEDHSDSFSFLRDSSIRFERIMWDFCGLERENDELRLGFFAILQDPWRIPVAEIDAAVARVRILCNPDRTDCELGWHREGEWNSGQLGFSAMLCDAREWEGVGGSGREWWEWKGRERKRAIRDSSQAEQLFPLECASFVLWCTVVNVPLF